jgi:hypothetical protein
MRRQDAGRDNLIGRTDATGPGGVHLSANDAGEFPIRIARDGTWFYRGSPIRRKELARLFSTVLSRGEDGRYWLKTPVEQGVIEVEDAPFTAVEMDAAGEGKGAVLCFRTNFGDWVTAGPDHPIRVEQDAETGQPSPYITVRDNLDALILRSVFYSLVDRAESVDRDGRIVLGVWSAGEFFELGEE